jgi:hypothetical protein
VSIALGTTLLLGGGAYGAYRYDAATLDRLLPGVRIAGVDVGELTRQEAIAAVSAQADGLLDREIEVQAGDETWSVTPRQLGTTVDVERLVDAALALNDDYAWPERVFRRLANTSVDHTSDLRLRVDRTELRRFAQTIAEEVSVEPSNAAVDYVDGELVLTRPEPGWTLPAPQAKRALREAILSGSPSAGLSLDRIEPEVGRDDLGYTIVVDLGDLELSLYDGLRSVKTYPVAAGTSQYPTPQGEWTVVDKVENPTWTNPDPTGWGAGLPLTIPPGPTNPLGTRALYLDAPGIRIHGTSASYSIGSYASHGCIRMYMDDVEELFSIVPVGTTVHVVP